MPWECGRPGCLGLRVWRIAMFRPSTTALPAFGHHDRISPSLPLSLPASTTTLSPFFNFSSHQSTSGASEMIFMKFLRAQLTNNRPEDTGADGSLLLFRMTAALRSKRIAVPSSRRNFFGGANDDGLAHVAFLYATARDGFLDDTTMMSPTDAYLRLEPPRTLMH